MKFSSNKPLLALSVAASANIAFIIFVWKSGSDFLTNTGFLVLGALIAIITSFVIEIYNRSLRAKDLARVLHAELADLVARCCFDSEAPWQQYWSPNPPAHPVNVIDLRKFAPNDSLIFSVAAVELALLPGNVPLLLIQFQYRVNALRREIKNIADDSSEDNRVDPIAKRSLKLVGLRFRQTLEPGLNALEELAKMVPDPKQIEAFAIKQYDATRQGAPPAGTLRDRVGILLKVPYSN